MTAPQRTATRGEAVASTADLPMGRRELAAGLREGFGLSLSGLAVLIGLGPGGQGTVSRWEAGIARIHPCAGAPAPGRCVQPGRAA